mgnify:CR=1 FL=1
MIPRPPHAQRCFFVCLVVLPLITHAGPNMQDGLWEITMAMEMPGMPYAIPPTKHTQCLNTKNNIPQQHGGASQADCKMLSNRAVGDTVTWAMQCRSPGKSMMDMEGKITYSGDSFDGVTIMSMQGAGKAMKTTQRMSGRRLGPCKG